MDVSPTSSRIVDVIDWTLPPGNGWRLTCELQQDGTLLATNEYDLAAFDGIQPTLRQRLRGWLASLLTSL